MLTQNFTQGILDYNKNVAKMSCSILGSFSDQAAKTSGQILEMTPNIPEEGKKVVDIFFKENQKGLTNLRKCVETSLDIDWTSHEAVGNGLEVMESFYNSTINQTTAIQNEAKQLFKKTSDQLPNEAKPIVECLNESFNSNFQIFQNFVTKNFALAQKVMADVVDVAPKAASKAAK